MLEVVGCTVSYATIYEIHSLQIIIAIASAEGLPIFFLDISNAFHNIIPPNPEELVHIKLPHLYLEWSKIKWSKDPLATRNYK